MTCHGRGLLVVTALALSLTSASAVAETLSVERLRTKTEYLGMRGGAGPSGPGVALTVVTLRWEWLYWGILRGGIAGTGEVENQEGLYYGGTVVGLPLHVGDAGRHEFRIGSAVGIGYKQKGKIDYPTFVFNPDGKKSRGVCLAVAPELYYIWHFEPIFAFLLGAELVVSVDFERSPAMFVGFFGAAF